MDLPPPENCYYIQNFVYSFGTFMDLFLSLPPHSRIPGIREHLGTLSLFWGECTFISVFIEVY